MNFVLKNCLNGEQIIVANDLLEYMGDVITINTVPGCFEVIGTSEISQVSKVVIKERFQNCQECTQLAFSLTDCFEDGYGVLYSNDQNLLQYIGRTVKAVHFRESCFTVAQVQHSNEYQYLPTFDIAFDYINCIFCKTQEAPAPLFETGACDEQKVIDIKCSFSEMMYQQIEARRLGIDFCCPLDKTKWTIKNEVLNNDLLMDVSPDLPEPYVEPCCITAITKCPPSTCVSCDESATEVAEDCNCTASENSPHDCHTYAVETDQVTIDLATGNGTEYYNSKVFFAYYKCKATKPTIIILEADVPQDICVLGIPTFGYYAANEWVEIITIIRGAICEPEIDNTCCNG